MFGNIYHYLIYFHEIQSCVLCSIKKLRVRYQYLLDLLLYFKRRMAKALNNLNYSIYTASLKTYGNDSVKLILSYSCTVGLKHERGSGVKPDLK
jgi:hypothetical protein